MTEGPSAGVQLPSGSILRGSQGKQWKVKRKIGQGRCCVAYESFLVGEDVPAVVKLYRPQVNFAAACQREAKLFDILSARTCGSKYLVRKFDEFKYNGQEVLVQELLGESLYDYIRLDHHTEEKMSLWRIQKFILDILKCMEILHIRGFVHGDLKPANVHWSPDDYCAKLIDFGLAFHIQDKVRGLLQSTHYRAPEAGDTASKCLKIGFQPQVEGEKHASVHTRTATVNCLAQPAIGSEDCRRDRSGDSKGDQTLNSSNSNCYSSISSKSRERGTKTHSSINLELHKRKFSEHSQKPGSIAQLEKVVRSIEDFGTKNKDTAYELPHEQTAPGEFRNVPSKTVLRCNNTTAHDANSTMQSNSNENFQNQIFCNCSDCGRHLSPALDIWSVGCLALKLFLGRGAPYFGGKPVCKNCECVDSAMLCETSVDASSLIQMRLEDEDLDEDEAAAVVNDLKDLVQRCMMCSPTSRLSVVAAISHSFFKHHLKPSFQDMLLLPSRVLCLLNMVDEADLDNDEEHKDVEDDIRGECEKFGAINHCVLCRTGLEKAKAFVHFTEARNCMEAWKQLNGRTFNARTVITCYSPHELFFNNILQQNQGR